MYHFLDDSSPFNAELQLERPLTLRAINQSQGAAPHPACGHFLPRAEKETSPTRTEKVDVSMPKLNLLADFGQQLFHIALVRQRVGVRAPEFFHHLALRHERAFRLGIFMRVVNLP